MSKQKAPGSAMNRHIFLINGVSYPVLMLLFSILIYNDGSGISILVFGILLILNGLGIGYFISKSGSNYIIRILGAVSISVLIAIPLFLLTIFAGWQTAGFLSWW